MYQAKDELQPHSQPVMSLSSQDLRLLSDLLSLKAVANFITRKGKSQP